jgi:hypothetical protein
MALRLLLGVVLFASVAQAETAVQAAPPPLACGPEGACPEGTSCLAGYCVPGTPSFFDRLSLSIGLGAFGEMFPVSSQKVPGDSRGQISMLGGARFWIGTHLPDRFRLLAVLEFGFATAGSGPASGPQGMLEGAGLEVTLETFKWPKPFLRFIYNAQVFSVRTTNNGAIADNAYFVSAGVRISIAELHLSIGRDFAGGFSPGFGLSVGWLY